MTILTKPSNEKKPEKVPLPTAPPHDNGTLLAHQSVPAGYLSDAETESMVFNRREYSCIKTGMLFATAILIMMLGILGGYYLYRSYAPAHANMHYRALYDIPYTLNNMSLPRFAARNDEFETYWSSLFPSMSGIGAINGGAGAGNDDKFGGIIDDNFFREEIEMDMSDDESFAKIDVPNFKDGRRGRFMHDFKENQSAIIDIRANRCFIMPLDRETILPPKSFLDLMQKLANGYYNIDTDRVRRKMRVVTPPVKDLSTISERIANECYDMKIYQLENYVSGVAKREIHTINENGKFAEFAGKGIVEFDLVNIGDIEKYEENAQH